MYPCLLDLYKFFGLIETVCLLLSVYPLYQLFQERVWPEW
jgi:hypothetical protein